MKFGSEELHLELRKACDTGDLGYAAELLYEPVKRTVRFYFAKKHEYFRMYTSEDQEDAIHDALLYMLERLEKLAYPENEGTPNYSYYAMYVFHGMSRSRYRLRQREKNGSVDDPVADKKGTGDDKEQTYLDTTPSTLAQPEPIALARDELHTALRAFFKLNNDPETLVSVGFIILNETLGLKPMSMKQYAEYFNGHQVTAILSRIENALNLLNQDVSILAPVKKRLHVLSEPPQFSGITESKLANRKNSILTKLRSIIKQEDEEE